MSAYRQRLFPRYGHINHLGARLPVVVLGEEPNGWLLMEVVESPTTWDRISSYLKSGRPDRLWLKAGTQIALPRERVTFR